MIAWTQEQKDEIWRLYTDEQLTFAQIAERYAHLGATRSAISGIITRKHKAREEEVEREFKTKKDKSAYQRRTGAYGGYNTRGKKAPLTDEEIKKIKEAQKR